MSLLETFREISINTWYRLGEAHRFGASMSEETLTDLNLLSIQSRHPFEIKTTWYKKSEEKKNGADWEWWFISGNKCAGFRIQAKKLYYPSQEYSAFHEKQREVLVNDASTATPKRIPLYVFYNHFTDEALKHDFQYGCEPREITYHGCSVASAHSISNLKSKKLEKFVPFLYPLSAILCGEPQLSIVEEVVTTALRIIHGNHGDWKVEDFVVSEAPSYVYKLLRGEELTNDDWNIVQANRLMVVKENL